MSAVPGELRVGAARDRESGLPARAAVYLGVVVAATIAAAAPLVPRIDSGTHGWPAVLVLATCAALAQIFVVPTTRAQSYHTSTAFLIAGALLLPPELVILMGIAQHVPEWLRHRYPWYIQSFNICNYTLDGLAAWGVARLVIGGGPVSSESGARVALAGLAPCLVFVGLNHVLMAGMLFLARGHRPKDTGLFSAPMLATELVL